MDRREKKPKAASLPAYGYSSQQRGLSASLRVSSSSLSIAIARRLPSSLRA